MASMIIVPCSQLLTAETFSYGYSYPMLVVNQPCQVHTLAPEQKEAHCISHVSTATLTHVSL